MPTRRKSESLDDWRIRLSKYRHQLYHRDIQASRKKANKKAKRRYRKNLLVNREKNRIWHKAWCDRNREKVRAGVNAYCKKYRDGLRTKVIKHYGEKCACCGESHVEFLVIDHKNGDGASHRKLVGRRSHEMYRWAIKNGYPNHLQLLCHNCNAAKQYYGICPHQREASK
jgi:hypothetical protein